MYELKWNHSPKTDTMSADLVQNKFPNIIKHFYNKEEPS